MSHYQITYKGKHTGWRRGLFAFLRADAEFKVFATSDHDREYIGNACTHHGAMMIIRRHDKTVRAALTTEDVTL